MSAATDVHALNVVDLVVIGANTRGSVMGEGMAMTLKVTNWTR